MSKQFLYQNENVSDSFPLCGRSFVVRCCKFVLIIHHRELIYFCFKIELFNFIAYFDNNWNYYHLEKKIIEIVLIAEHIFCSMNSVKINK